jgi:hypothetical protein
MFLVGKMMYESSNSVNCWKAQELILLKKWRAIQDETGHYWQETLFL